MPWSRTWREATAVVSPAITRAGPVRSSASHSGDSHVITAEAMMVTMDDCLAHIEGNEVAFAFNVAIAHYCSGYVGKWPSSISTCFVSDFRCGIRRSEYGRDARSRSSDAHA